MRKLVRGATMATAALAAACSTLPDRRPEAPALPEQWAEAAVRPDVSVTSWWTSFDDPMLTALVEEGLAAGPSVRLAALRVLEARATGRNTLTQYLPQLSAAARLQYTESLEGPPLVGSFQSFVTGGEGVVPFEDRQAISSIGPEISWEIPLFQRVGAAAFGARANTRAALEDLRATQVALAGDVAEAYLSLRAAQQRQAALVEAVAIADETARILQRGVDAGLSAPAEAADARRLAESTRARLPDAAIEIRRASNVLATLRGRAPGTEPAAVAEALAAAGPIPAAALAGAPLAPADLIRARPDVAQAEAQALFQAAELGLARSELLPQITLTGSIAVTDNVIGSALSESQTQLQAGPAISVPLFDWGRRFAAIRASDARFEQALERYQQTVQVAVAEASNALAALSQSERRIEAARAAEAAAEINANGQREAFEAGLTSLRDRLLADQQLIDARLTRIEAEAARAQAAVLTYRAFAGGPPADTLLQAVDAARVKSPEPEGR